MSRSIFFLGMWVVVVAWFGQLIAGIYGLIFGLIVLGGALVWAWFHSDVWILRICSAKEVNAENTPVLYHALTELVQRISMPMPKLYMIEAQQPNAFALGRNAEHASIVVTSELLKMLNIRELKAVLAHELAHIHRNDIALSRVVIWMIELFMFGIRFSEHFLGSVRGSNKKLAVRTEGLSHLFKLFMTFLAAINLHVGVSRSMEYEADQFAVDLLQDKNLFIEVLQKLEGMIQVRPMDILEQRPALAHIMTINGLEKSMMNDFFLTQPTVKNRIKKITEA
jgi:heat shock protein HtpX